MEKMKKENGSISNISNYPDSWIPRFMKEKTKAKRLVVYLIDQCPLDKNQGNWCKQVYHRRVEMIEKLEDMTDKEFEAVINGKKPDSS